MSVFSKINTFLIKHRAKFFIGGVILTGSVLLTRYAQNTLRKWQQNEAKEFYERTRKQQHFESTERTCNQTILSLVAALNEALNKAFNVDDVLAELRTNPDNKLELWNQLKVLVFSKVSTMIYVTVLLVITLRVQLNILGGYLYKNPSSITLEEQEKYLLLCHSLLSTGVVKLSDKLTNEYKNILELIPLNRELKLADIERIFWSVQVALRDNSNDPVKNLRQYIILNDGKPTDIVRDTADLLETEEVVNITNSCINRSFALVGDRIAEFYGPNAASSDSFVHPAELKIALAKLVPILNGIVSKNSLLDVLIQQLLINDKLKTLGANVYEAFSFAK